METPATAPEKLLDGPLTRRWLPQVEGVRCSVVEVFALVPFYRKSQSSTKLFKCKAASSPAPENCSLMTKFSKAGLISYEGAEVAGVVIGVLIKSSFL